MSRRRLVAPGVALAGIGAAVAAVLVLPLPSFGTASPPPEPPAIWQPPDTPPLRPVTVEPTALAESAAPTPSVVPQTSPLAPKPQGCQPTGDHEPLTDAQVLSYYGNPYTADMGILGELPPQALVEKLQEHAQLYDSLNGTRGVQPALHLVYGTAQSQPGSDGLYLLYVDDETLREYIQLACDNDMLIFLDLQIGRSDVRSELTKILPFLEEPHVHVALDPEFAMAPGEVPGEAIGSLDAADVNGAQALLQDFLEERDLPDKVLVVHQFTKSMLTRPELIEDLTRVKLVIDMDGFGPSEIKRVKYDWYAAPAEHSGFKLFYQHDTDLMSEQEVLELNPDVIIYQ